MAASKKEEAVVKKIKPYPFPIQVLKEGLPPIQGSVVKLVIHGFMAELGSVVVKVGDLYQVQFTLPGSNVLTTATVKVIKTYDKYTNPDAPTKALRLAEFHFTPLGDELKSRVKSFLKQIKQVGTDLV